MNIKITIIVYNIMHGIMFFIFISIVCNVIYGQDNQRVINNSSDIDTLFMQGEEISLSTALEQANRYNIDILLANLQLASLKFTRDTSFSVLYPSITGTATINYSKSIADNRETNIETMTNPLTMSVGLSAQLLLNMGLISGIQLRIQQYKKGLITVQQVKMSIEKAIKKQYYALLLQQENINAMQETIKLLEKRYEQYKNIAYAGGSVSQTDVRRSKVMLEQQRPELLRQLNLYRVSMQQLKILMSYDMDTVLHIKIVPLPVYPIIVTKEYLLEHGLYNNMKYAELQINHDLLYTQRMSNILQNFTPTFITNFSTNVQNRIGTTTIPDGKTESSIDNFDYGFNFSLSVQMDFAKLIPGSQTWAQIYTVNKQIEQSAKSMQKFAIQLDNDIDEKLIAVQVSWENIKALELNKKLVNQVYTDVYNQYMKGFAQFLDVRDADNNRLNADIQILGEKQRYINTIIDLEELVGIELLANDKHVRIHTDGE